MSKADLRKAADIAPNTITKLSRDEAVNLAILGLICETFDCDFGKLGGWFEKCTIEIRQLYAFHLKGNILCIAIHFINSYAPINCHRLLYVRPSIVILAILWNI